MNKPIRLNVGAGGSELPGFTSIDIKSGTDITKGLPYGDGSVSEIYASHVLEHIHHSLTDMVMAEFARVLEPNGLLRIAVPDWDKVEDQRRNGLMSPALYQAWVYGSYDDPTDRHLAQFSQDSLIKCFLRAGFENVAKWEPELKDCSSLPVSLNLCGTKRQVVIKRDPVVACVLSTPRIGFCDFYKSFINVAQSLGWGLIERGGTEWGRGLTQAVVAAIQQMNPDYILCLDYDSVFTKNDCLELLRIMQENPHIGALFPTQQHRHKDAPLGFHIGANMPKYSPDGLTEHASGHFGLTMIRRQVFDTLPQPWFMTLPNAITADMGTDALDADIYFWVAIRDFGWRAFSADNVTIGHLELCVKWPRGAYTGWQPIQHFRANGRPEWARLDGPALNRRMDEMKESEFLKMSGGKPRDTPRPPIVAKDIGEKMLGVLKDKMDATPMVSHNGTKTLTPAPVSG